MTKRIWQAMAVLLIVLSAYLLFWPVPIDPVAWNAPKNPGYTGSYAPNEGLAGIERLKLGAHSGPEDAALGPDGALYIATHEGGILKYDPASGKVSLFAETGGRPLGVEFDRAGELYVADAFRGLLRISGDGEVVTLANKTASGSPILYADDLDIATDGTVYFTDASTKFGARENGGTLPASLLDLMEHGPNGRVLRYTPATGETTTFLDGLSFANGLAVTESGSHFLVVETGTYSILKVPVDGAVAPEVIVENLPGFPDNINRNPEGTFWVGIVSPRSPVADAIADKPFLKKVVMRLPAVLRPAAQRYGFVIKINEDGDILETLQDPSGGYALTTGLIEGAEGARYVTSLTEPDLGILKP
ncbi:SMP-30/gluconolactonase/LRE family protein [Labrenzia sp. PHM005]|uniref:SMP-30/gluconolactonase/LRE family protein n=1 Tax=Labrenzia sp. PHM005 TaxID=2590016 RepID=UPI001AD90DDF|nr:SMP-30/gluconolactonase/LRE family protein [Labrenzia sp. PHM005]